jgi:hypothetical protein
MRDCRLAACVALLATIDLTGQAFWLQRFPATVPWPNGLLGATASFDATRQRVMVFGGGDSNANLFDGLWEWSGSDWVNANPTVRPPARQYHAATSLWPTPGFVIHGGTSSSSLFGDTWFFDGVRWNSAPTGGPQARLLHAMSFDLARRVVVLFGGASIRALTTTLADTWEWDGAQWQARQPVASPSAREGHVMAFDLARGRTVMYGGATNGSTGPVLGDTWEYDGTTWVQRTPSVSPGPRVYGSMVYDLQRARVILFGGRTALNSGTLDEAWVWDSPGNQWVRLSPQGPTCGPRDLVATAYDLSRARLVVAGGYRTGAGGLNDTWEMLPAPPVANATGYGAGCAGTAGIPTLSAVGLPRLGNALFAVRLAQARATSAAALAVSGGRAAINLPGGCTWLVASPPIFVFGTTDTGGVLVWQLPVANVPIWLGEQLYLQGLVSDPQGAFSGLLSLTAGLQLTLGT